ncbi:MAG: hypothetical protein IKS97_00945 [Fibrobacter sp.]|nr:hypothetical protein [Fibrobacter sp.]
MLYILYVLFLIVVTGLVTWARFKNPDPARQDRIADDLFDIAMKVGKEKREGMDTSGKEAAYEEASKMVEKTDIYDIVGEDPFDVAMKIGKEKREGKDTSDKEKYYEFVKKHRNTGDGVSEWIDKL